MSSSENTLLLLSLSSSSSSTTRPPTMSNPVGDGILTASCVTFALVVLFVGLRLLGRWHQRERSPAVGESHHYVEWSDLTIVVSLVSFYFIFIFYSYSTQVIGSMCRYLPT